MLKKYISKSKVCRERIFFMRKGTVNKTKFMSQEDLAAQLRLINSKISRDDIKIIELGKRDIFDIEIIWFAKIFNVSIEYLLGVSDDYTVDFDECDSKLDTSLKDRANVCGIWLRNARKKRKISQDMLAMKMNERGFNFATHSAVSKIEKGTRRMRLSETVAFAEILEIPIIFLFKGPNKQLPNIESFENYVAQDD